MHFVDIRFKTPRYCVNGGSTRPPAVGGGQVGGSANHGHASVGSRGKYKQCLGCLGPRTMVNYCISGSDKIIVPMSKTHGVMMMIFR